MKYIYLNFILCESATEQLLRFDLWRYIYPIICLKSVCLSGDVRKVQVAILGRLPREMSQTDRILPRYEFASQFDLEFVYTQKKRKPRLPGPPQSIAALWQINN